MRNLSFKNSSQNLKWPSYIFQILHSSVLLNETPERAVERIDNMLLDIPNHRFIFSSQEEKLRRISETMDHVKLRARASKARLKDLIDGIDRSRG